MTTQEGRTIHKSLLTPTVVSSLQRGTFSRAGGPRIKQGQNDIIDKMTSKSLYQQISDQNMNANRNNNLPKRQRVAISQSFKSAQKSFSRCNMLNEASKYGYSVADVDYESIVHNN
jgi:hypothetical protein